jgi:glycine/D-amino acid oxidase-like deaminating enzyme
VPGDDPRSLTGLDFCLHDPRGRYSLMGLRMCGGGFILDVGWGTYGFKAGPAAGKNIAELISSGQTPEMIRPFALERFYNDELIGEKAAAAVSH